MEVFDYLPESFGNTWDYWEPTLNGQIHVGQYWIFGVLILLMILIHDELDFIDKLEWKSVENKEKIIDKIHFNHIADVNWRRSLIVSLIVGFILCFFVFYPLKIPPGFVYFFVTLIIFGATYFSTAWTNSHWWKMNSYKIEESLLSL